MPSPAARRASHVRATIALALAAFVAACADAVTPKEPIPTSISVTLSAPAIHESGTGQASAIVKDQDGEPISGVEVAWVSSDPTIATVEAAGSTAIVTGLVPGQVTISASVGSIQGSVQVSIVERRVASVTIEPVLDTANIGDVIQFSAVAKDSAGGLIEGRTVAWTTPDTSRAVVNDAGTLTVKWAGALSVTARVDGVDGSREFVVVPVESVPFDIRSVKLWVGNVPGMFNEYLGQPLDASTFESWHDVLREIRDDNANNVNIMMSAGVMEYPTDNDFSDTISYNPPLDAIRQLAAEAQSLGLSVTISTFTHVANVITGSSGDNLDRPSPADPQVWFENYRTRILEWARFAQEIGAHSMIPFQDETQHLLAEPSLTTKWVQLIQAIRGEFSGKLTTLWWTPGYGNSVTRVPAEIIAQLDYLGIGVFPDLVRAEGPDVETLCRAYRADADGNNVIAFVRAMSQQYGKNVWITDKAFHSFRGAAYDEWRVFDPSIELTPSQEEQQRLYESFMSVMQVEGRGWLVGASFQNFNNIVDGGLQIARFIDGPVSESPQHKLAESTLREWFGGQRRSSCRIE